MKLNRKIVLEDGREYYGYSFGPSFDKVCEIVFNTSMTGYQEILSDPSYTDQAVVMTYPLIGNYGMAREDYETDHPSIGAMIVRDYNDQPSNFRSRETLAQVMDRYHIPGIAGVDTRSLTRWIRDNGSGHALLTAADTDLTEALAILRKTELTREVVAKVSCKESRIYEAVEEKHRIVAIDCGMKKNIIRSFLARGISMILVPYNSSAEEIRQMKPDGIFISNGPGNPEDLPETIATVTSLIGEFPIFGICLGHQLISLAYGARTYKLKFGHRGGNHPVLNCRTGKIEITSQNHSYAVDPESLKNTPLEVTHRNLLDQTVEGAACSRDRIFSVQYHPESAPGPQDSSYLFEIFIDYLK